MRAFFTTDQISDQIAFFNDIRAVRHLAFRVIDRAQLNPENEKPGEQIIGIAVALIALCQSSNVSLDRVINVAQNAMADADGPFSEHIKAIRDYARYELRGGGR